MHELGITQSILQIALEHARKAGAGRIRQINIVTGGLSGIVAESIQFYFDFVSRETPAEGAKLVFTKVPARFRCRNCNNEFDFSGADWTCPACQTSGPEIVCGRECYVDSLEVD